MKRALLLLIAVSCGPPAKVGINHPKPQDALKEFDAGLRALRLGGPEANGQAAERFQKAVSIDGKFVEAWHNLGVVKERMGDDRGAVDAFSHALTAGAGRASRLSRAEAERSLERWDDAKNDYTEALKSDDDDTATRIRLASACRESKDYDAAMATIREVLRRTPADPKANLELGLIYYASGKLDLADLVLSKVAAANPKDAQVWNALGLLSLARGKDQEGFDRFDHATSLDPDYRDARFNKASVLLDSGDYARAQSELEAALNQRPTDTDTDDDVDVLLALGVAYRGLGKYDLAKATWGRVLKVEAMQPDALFNLAVLDMDFLHDDAGAKDLLEKFLLVAPDSHPRAKEAQDRLKEASKS